MKNQTSPEGVLHKAGSGLAAFFRLPVFQYTLVQVFLLSCAVNLFVEACSRQSLLKPFVYLFQHPLIFLLNTLLIGIVIIPAALFRKKRYFYLLFSLLWAIVGLVDLFLLTIGRRTTPFNANDFTLIADGIAIAPKYLSVFQIILFCLLIVLLIAGMIFAYLKAKPTPPERFRRKRAVLLVVLWILLGVSSTKAGMATGVLAKTFPYLADGYHDYGLPYCFICSLFPGMKKPSNYTPGNIQGVISPFVNTPTLSPDTPEKKPNVIFIQLESFFDPKRLAGIDFPEDPIPTFTKLMQQCSSGLLYVPSISAGTANTEFEILTGMNMADFAPGEYPYKTILRRQTCESIAYNLKSYGYSTHAIHNNTATFYGRDVVYQNLGFETFMPIELMTNVAYNKLGWAKDKVLIEQIVSALGSTSGSDFIFTVSVQGHGNYPDEDILEDSIPLTDINDAYDDHTIYGLKYYVSQLKEMDDFIADLITYLNHYQEDTVLVLYGDHLPGFEFSEESLTKGTLLQTEYVIWSNFAMEPVHRDLYAYQLSAEVCARLGYHEGLVCKLHQAELSTPGDSYLENLNLLAYDMLYGEQFCFGGVNPYAPTTLTFGFHDIKCQSLSAIYDASEEYYYVTITGSGFTPYSVITVDGEVQKNTIYLNETTLFLPQAILQPGATITVGMPHTDSTWLRQSDPLIFTESDIVNPAAE